MPEILESVAPYANETHNIKSPKIFPTVFMFMCCPLASGFPAANPHRLRSWLPLEPRLCFHKYPQMRRTEVVHSQSREFGFSLNRDFSGLVPCPIDPIFPKADLVRSQLRREVGFLDGRAMSAGNRGAVYAVFPQDHSH